MAKTPAPFIQSKIVDVYWTTIVWRRDLIWKGLPSSDQTRSDKTSPPLQTCFILSYYLQNLKLLAVLTAKHSG